MIRETWPAAWLIESWDERDPDTGEKLFWSNAEGWTDLASADRFTYPERCRLNLPARSDWICGAAIWPPMERPAR